jgi:2-methylcitrate dehydratase PrpD
MNTSNPSRLLANFVAGLKYEDIPAVSLEHAKTRVIDFYASAMAGKKINEAMNKIIVSYMRKMGGAGESPGLFGAGKLPAPNAAFVNAFYGHGSDLDDGHILAMGHPGVHIVPAVFAAADVSTANPRDILAAITAGYEIFVRISNGIMPSILNRGFHSTGIVGAVASAAAAAKILGLNGDGIHRALSLGAVSASGLFEVSQSAQAMKPVNPANAARTGIVSAQLAQAGAEAPEEPLSGVKGFFKAFADEVKIDEITGDIGKDLRIDSCYTKLYPACRHIHGLIDCGIAFYKAGEKPDNIEKIRLFLYPNGIAVTGTIREPADEGGAKFSLTYGAATALATGNFGLKDLRDVKNMSGTVRSLIKKMEVLPDPSLEVREKRLRGAKIEITRKDGSVEVRHVIVPKGEPQTPVTREDMRGKLAYCADGLYDGETQQKLFDLVFSFETLSGYGEITDILSR